MYNEDEMGFYFHSLPQHMCLFKSEDAKRLKNICVAVVGCVNMDVHKGKLLVVGKSKSPRCFKGIHKLPVKYTQTPVLG